jgi:hypothetical protein
VTFEYHCDVIEGIPVLAGSQRIDGPDGEVVQERQAFALPRLDAGGCAEIMARELTVSDIVPLSGSSIERDGGINKVVRLYALVTDHGAESNGLSFAERSLIQTATASPAFDASPDLLRSITFNGRTIVFNFRKSDRAPASCETTLVVTINDALDLIAAAPGEYCY